MLFAVAFVLAVVGFAVLLVGMTIGSAAPVNGLATALDISKYNFFAAIVVGAIVGQTVRGRSQNDSLR